jgi:hypothetical protein
MGNRRYVAPSNLALILPISVQGCANHKSPTREDAKEERRRGQSADTIGILAPLTTPHLSSTKRRFHVPHERMDACVVKTGAECGADVYVYGAAAADFLVDDFLMSSMIHRNEVK